MLLGEFLLKQLKEGTPHISGYILAKWGAVPNVPNVTSHGKTYTNVLTLNGQN